MENLSSDASGKKTLQGSGARVSNAHSLERRSVASVHQSFRSRCAKGDARRRSQTLQQEVETTIHVLDNGVDRTPLPLQRGGKQTGLPRSGAQGAGGVIRSLSQVFPESNSMFYSSMLNTSMDQIGLASSMGPSAPSQMGFLTASSSFTSVSADRRVSSSPLGSTAGAIHGLPQGGKMQSLLDEYTFAKGGKLTWDEQREWLNSKTTVVLSETPTIMLYMHQDEIVPNEAKDELLQVQKCNSRYAALVQAARVDEGTRFQEKGSWTFVVPKKSVHCSIHPPQTKNSGALQVTTWMLRDQFADLGEEDKDAASNDKLEDEEGTELEEESDNENEAITDKGEEQSIRGGTRSAISWMFAESLISTLRVMERVVVQNTMEEVQLLYRGITMDPTAYRVPRPAEVEDKKLLEDTDMEEPVAEGHDLPESPKKTSISAALKADTPKLKLSNDLKALWTFRSPLTRNRAVTCMAWNCKEADILAVGYSALITNDTQPVDAKYSTPGGIICCWSLKNPLAPENVIRLSAEAGVSSIAFSYEYPSLLAVGNTEGDIVIYDIQKETNVPAIKTTMKSGQHTGAVWELKWVARGKERGEFLMSISSDGRVVQWAVGKTIERVAPDLMTLKRQHGTTWESAFAGGNDRGNQQNWRKCDALFSRQCGGMCLDISPADGTIYVVGTEDGSIHQCSKSQTENYELDYAPHSELVYRIRWSPYSDKYFLTCSADWSARLYCLGQSKQLLTFDNPNQDAVQDVAWSYTNSSIFATVTARGSLEIWSIRDAIHPRSSAQYLDQRRLSQVLFAEQEAVVVVVGDEKGDVTVFRLLAPCYGSMNMMQDEQEQELEDAIRKATL